jgi:hypothetical protein
MRSAKVLIAGAVARVSRRFSERRATVAPSAPEAVHEDPEIAAHEVRELRDELRRELERLAGADIKASRTRRESQSPPG